MMCRKCGGGPNDIGGWLERVNPLGEKGIWECRPSCTATLNQEQRVLGAIKGEAGDTP